ncbi:MAG: fumarate hydratase [Candidatus Tritonobacter lacicola]|nr:fumarate hydratase [Candidatus Tritonobacter lacicola]
MVRDVDVRSIEDGVARMCMETNVLAPDDLIKALKKGMAEEEPGTAREIFRVLLENLEVARNENLPICQDTGMTVVFLDVGQDVHLAGGDVSEAVNEGVRRGYRQGYLRKSVVADPLRRMNTGDNTPAVIHFSVVPGDKVRVTVVPKGFGSENMSAIRMLKPTEGYEGIKRFVIDTIKNAGANPCPPIVVGIGVGGTFEKAALMSKEALTRPLGKPSGDENTRRMENDLLKEINKLGIGPQGLGGRVTALSVAVNTYPTHIAGLPVALNICCHVYRHASIEI